MSEIRENQEEAEGAAEAARDSSSNSVSSGFGDVAIEGERVGRPWKKILGFLGAGSALVGATAAVTLAATHKSAVTENEKAYVNGFLEGHHTGFINGLLAAAGFLDGADPDEDGWGVKD